SDPPDEWVKLGVQAQLAAQADPDPARQRQKFADAERHYRQALRLEPRHAIATQNLAVLFAQLGQVNEALLTIERAALFDGVHGVIHTNRAFMCLEADRIDEALAAARHAVGVTDSKDSDPSGYLASRLALA